MSNLKILNNLNVGVSAKRNGQQMFSNAGITSEAGVVISKGTLSNQLLTIKNCEEYVQLDLYFDVAIKVSAYTEITVSLPAQFANVDAKFFSPQMSCDGTFRNWERVNAIQISGKQTGNLCYIRISDDRSDTIDLHVHCAGIYFPDDAESS